MGVRPEFAARIDKFFQDFGHHYTPVKSPAPAHAQHHADAQRAVSNGSASEAAGIPQGTGLPPSHEVQPAHNTDWTVGGALAGVPVSAANTVLRSMSGGKATLGGMQRHILGGDEGTDVDDLERQYQNAYHNIVPAAVSKAGSAAIEGMAGAGLAMPRLGTVSRPGQAIGTYRAGSEAAPSISDGQMALTAHERALAHAEREAARLAAMRERGRGAQVEIRQRQPTPPPPLATGNSGVQSQLAPGARTTSEGTKIPSNSAAPRSGPPSPPSPDPLQDAFGNVQRGFVSRGQEPPALPVNPQRFPNVRMPEEPQIHPNAFGTYEPPQPVPRRPAPKADVKRDMWNDVQAVLNHGGSIKDIDPKALAESRDMTLRSVTSRLERAGKMEADGPDLAEMIKRGIASGNWKLGVAGAAGAAAASDDDHHSSFQPRNRGGQFKGPPSKEWPGHQD